MPDWIKYTFVAAGGAALVLATIFGVSSSVRAKIRKWGTFNGGNRLRTFEGTPSGRPRGHVTHETFK